MRKPLILVACLMLLPGTARAADPHEVAIAVSKEIMSPFCPGITLHDCPTRAALDLRDRIEGWAEMGWSKDRILGELVAEFGGSILAVPDEPLTPLSRLLPVVAIGGGAWFVWRAINRWQRRDGTSAVIDSATTAERAVLDAELDELRATR